MAEQTLLEYVVSELRNRSGAWPEISADTGIPYHTITKIASGRTKDPGVSKVDVLARYFRSGQRKSAA